MRKNLIFLVLNESQEVFQTDQGQNCPRSVWKALDREQPESKMGNPKFTSIINSEKKWIKNQRENLFSQIGISS